MSAEPPSAATPAELRAQAQHARRLAYGVPSDESAHRLWKLADQLEAQADALERQKPP
jgi:hypothetical protein